MTRQSVKRCVFCGRTGAEVKITREHVLPSWLKTRAAVSFGPGKEVWRVSGEKLEDAQIMAPFTRRPYIACLDCNTGWMRDLEERAHRILLPMLDGFGRSLDFQEQATVATWATKTCIALHWARHDIVATVPEAHLRALAAAQGWVPPSDVEVFLAVDRVDRVHADGSRHIVAFSSRNPTVEADGSVSVSGAAVYILTLRIHRFVCQVIGQVGIPDEAGLWLHPYAPDAVQRVWPREVVPLRWPPVKPLEDHGGFETFASRPDQWCD
jgi:hypothetical protein